jgi:PST family polysaccharide transporter
MSANDGRRLASGVLSTGLGQVARLGFQTGTLVLLGRLLRPEDFGLAAMVLPILYFATILQEAGLGAALMQRKSVSAPELAALFWVNTAIGLVLCLMLMALAPVMAGFFREPRVTGLMLASGPLVLISAMGAQPISLLNRDMNFGALAVMDTVSQGAGFAVGLGVALATRSYWALWLATAATITVMSVSGWWFSRVKLVRPAPLRQVRDLLWFGGHLTVNNVFIYMGRNCDNLLIGRRWGDGPLGYYDRAYRLMMMPLLLVSSPLQRLSVPVLARAAEEPERYRRVYLHTVQFMLLSVAPAVAALTAASHTGLLVILGPGWDEAARIFGWLGIASLLQLLANTFGWLYISQGRSKDMMWAGLASTCWAVGAFLVGLPSGALGVATAFTISEAIRLPVLSWWATRRGPVTPARFVGAMTPFALAIPVGLVAAAALDRLPVPSPLLRMIVVTGGCYLAIGAALLLTTEGRACWRRVLSILRRGFGSAMRRFAPA